MSNLDQRIDQAIIDALPQWFFDSDETGVVLTATLESATPAVIAVIREALLSDEAIDVAVDAYCEEDPGVPRDYGDMAKALSAAITAAFGEEASDD